MTKNEVKTLKVGCVVEVKKTGAKFVVEAVKEGEELDIVAYDMTGTKSFAHGDLKITDCDKSEVIKEVEKEVKDEVSKPEKVEKPVKTSKSKDIKEGSTAVSRLKSYVAKVCSKENLETPMTKEEYEGLKPKFKSHINKTDTALFEVENHFVAKTVGESEVLIIKTDNLNKAKKILNAVVGNNLMKDIQ